MPTLAVTCEERPRLLVNLDFVTEHCRSDAEVKALLCHEFLHVLLRHTEARKPFTPARHLALDAVINAIIHREHGPEYTALMSRYYADVPGLGKLLRPMSDREAGHYVGWKRGNPPLPEWVHAWEGLYAGTLLADDIEALAEQMGSAGGAGANAAAGELGPFTLQTGDADFNRMLGNHDDPSARLPDALKDALDRAMKEMNGSGIWRSPKGRGVGANPYEAVVSSRNEPMERWQRRTLAVLREHLLPDPRAGRSGTSRPPIASRCCRRATGGRSCARSGRRSCPRHCGKAPPPGGRAAPTSTSTCPAR